VEQVQRTKVLETLAELIVERGVGGVSMGEVLARTSVSSGALHEAFPDREACLLAAFDLAVERACRRMAAEYDAQARWLDGVKAALVQFLGFLEDEPALGRLLVVYSMSGGERVLRRRAQVVGELAALIDGGRLESPRGRQQPPAVIAEGVVGAVLAVLQNRLLGNEPDGFMDLFGSLVSIIVLPYLGAGVARRELARPAPRAGNSAGLIAVEGAGGGLERGAGVRLTYRTARVLGAIGDYPGASNREVADRAGIVDQGQVSKLLGRLQARGLIAKMGATRARGAPNSWRLTERGELALKDVCVLP
jgi:AcrR family transcriptional regulator